MTISVVKISIAVRKAFIAPLLLFLMKLSLVIFFIVDFYEAWESLIGSYTALTFQDIDHYAIRTLLDSLPCQTGFFGETSSVIKICFVAEIVDTVKELASLTILAVAFFMILLTHFCFVVGW